MSKQIIGLGGGGFSCEESPCLDLYILQSAQKRNPTICFLPTASGDDVGIIHLFMHTFKKYPCVPKYLNILSPNVKHMDDFLLSSDIIYVGGGNTKSMLALWKEWGIDKILKQAYESGIILSGVSAGFVCWFETCITDSIPRTLTPMPCLGLLPGSGCPHYGENRKRAYHYWMKANKIAPGYAADDSVALHFMDGDLHKVVSSDPYAAAYRVYKNAESNNVVEDKLDPLYLGSQENFEKFIMPMIDMMSGEEIRDNVQ